MRNTVKIDCLRTSLGICSMTCASLNDNSTFIIFTFRLTTYQFTFLFQIYIYHILPIHHPPAPMPALPRHHPQHFARVMRQHRYQLLHQPPFIVFLAKLPEIPASSDLAQQKLPLLLVRLTKQIIIWHPTDILQHPHHRSCKLHQSYVLQY